MDQERERDDARQNGPERGSREQYAGHPRGRRLGRRARWAVPVAAVAAVGAVIAGTAVAGAQSTPTLPARSAAQLIADLQRATGPGPLSATLQVTANLGLPDLPGSNDMSSPLALLSGSHTFMIWYANPTHVRVAEPVQLGESDLRRDGRQVWLWNSRNQTATHLVLPVRPAGGKVYGGQAPGGKAGLGKHAGPRLPGMGQVPTPQQVARQVLAAVGPTTTVSVQQNVSVAGQSAYQLVVAPKSSSSLIGRISIAVDANRFFPLRVQVFARGATSPAFQLGFTSLTFGTPAAANFSFTPPPGAKVKTTKLPAAGPGALGQFGLFSASPARDHAWLRHGTTKHGAAKHGKNRLVSKPSPNGSFYSIPSKDWYSSNQITGAPVQSVESIQSFAPAAQPRVLGKGWLSVLVIPAGAPLPTATATAGGTASVVAVSPSSGAQVAPVPGGLPPALGALLRAATPVHGAWGSGRLLRTSLFSALITSKGTVLVGAVTPAVLYADAAAVK